MSPVGEGEVLSHEQLLHGRINTTSPPGSSHNTMEVVDAGVQERLTLLEEENANLRASCATLQHQLQQTQQDGGTTQDSGATQQVDNNKETSTSCCRCQQLTEELRLSQVKCTELQQLHQTLEDQLSTLQTETNRLQTQEEQLTREIKILEQRLQETAVIVGEDSAVGAAGQLMTTTDSSSEPEVSLASVQLEQNAPSLPGIEEDQLSPPQLLQQWHKRLEVLEKENQSLQEQCRAAEKEKATLRTNIRKVSANWFERKNRLSDSDSESHHSGEGNVYERQESFNSHEEVGVQVPDTPPENIFIYRTLDDLPKLLAAVSFASGKLDLTERMCCELKKRVKEYENVIDDQEIIIHGLKDQLDTYFNDNQNMSQQLSTFSKLFEDLQLTEKTCVKAVNPPDTSNATFSNLPTADDFKQMSSSVSKTFMKLKDLIFEKKSLVSEIERLNVLNVELQRRVTQQENRLVNVSDALHTTWMLVSDLKEQHAQLHSSESILRYELKEKRELLHNLREELECSREQWHKIRQMNLESEEAWNGLKEELNERRRVAELSNKTQGSGNDQDKEETEKIEGATAAKVDHSSEFEPPVDLLLDMAIEYGVIDADDDTSTAMIAAMEGEDMHANRLQELEDQCGYLYQKLMASTARSLTLASRLSALHQHYGSSDDEDDDDDDDEEDYEDDEDEEEEYYHDTDILSPEPESSDTAYMSEADTGSAASVAPGNLSEEEGMPSAEGSTNEPPFSDESPEVDDDLSKRLINFLPKKIEILHRENKKLEEKCNLLQEEKAQSELQLTESLEAESRLRRQMEEKLEHLGKCVDELKLERNGKISEVEEKLKQKIASYSDKEKEYENLREEVDVLKEKYEERGRLLRIATDRVNELEAALNRSEATTTNTVTQLNQANAQVSELESMHSELNNEYKQLKVDMETLQEQVADLRFQVSSKVMECDAAVKADAEKSEALTAATLQINEREARISELEKESVSQKELLHTEQDRLSVQVNELTKSLTEQNSHCSVLDNRLQQAETEVVGMQQKLSETQTQLTSTKEISGQLDDDNLQLREKIIQLLSRRVRVCDECFSVQTELATIVATPASCNISSSTQSYDASSAERESSENQTTSTAQPLPIGTRQPDDSDFAVISDDEVHTSRLSSSPSSSSPPSSNGTVTDVQATNEVLTFDSLLLSPPTNTEVWVSAETRVIVPVDLPVGVTLLWNFVSEPKSVSFAVLHQPQDNSHQSSQGSAEGVGEGSTQRVLIPTTRVASTQGSSVRGRLLTKQPGVYSLVFDNSFSRFTAKKVTYSLKLDKSKESPRSLDVVAASPSSSASPLPMP